MSETFDLVLMTFKKDAMLRFLREHPEELNYAADLALDNRQPLSWRSAWVLWSLFQEGVPFPQGFSEKILAVIQEKRDGHQRELLKLLWISGIDEEEEGRIFDLCATLWEDIRKDPSIRILALKWMFRISGEHPELLIELPYYLQEKFTEPLSPGVKRSLEKLRAAYLPAGKNKPNGMKPRT